MAIPTYQSTGSYLSGGAGTSAAIPVPSGVAVGSFILAVLYIESAAAVTPAAGFQEAPESGQNTVAPKLQYCRIFWKRATAADAGTYSFTWSGSAYREGVALRCEGVYPVGDPWDTPAGSARSSDDALTPSVLIRTAQPEQLWVYVATNFAGGDWPGSMSLVATSGFGARTTADSDIWVGTLGQAGYGSSGFLQAQCANSSYATSWLGALKSTDSKPRQPPMLSRTAAVRRAGNY